MDGGGSGLAGCSGVDSFERSGCIAVSSGEKVIDLRAVARDEVGIRQAQKVQASLVRRPTGGPESEVGGHRNVSKHRNVGDLGTPRSEAEDSPR